MKYLLDTCIILSWLQDPESLKKSIQKILKEEQLYLSVASIWEIVIKCNIGKLNIVPHNILEIIRKQNIAILDIKTEHIFALLELPSFHKDPFDRLLISVAKCENLTLITKDKNIYQYPVEVVKAS